jgi:transcriptional regulator with XRE-family HTH domain
LRKKVHHKSILCNNLHMIKKTMTPLELAQLLDKRRRDRGMTQEQLAAAANVSRRTINAFVQGDTDIGIRRLIRLCSALDLVLDLQPGELLAEQKLPSTIHVEE